MNAKFKIDLHIHSANINVSICCALVRHYVRLATCILRSRSGLPSGLASSTVAAYGSIGPPAGRAQCTPWLCRSRCWWRRGGPSRWCGGGGG